MDLSFFVSQDFGMAVLQENYCYSRPEEGPALVASLLSDMLSGFGRYVLALPIEACKPPTEVARGQACSSQNQQALACHVAASWQLHESARVRRYYQLFLRQQQGRLAVRKAPAQSRLLGWLKGSQASKARGMP